jgi:hypothetical protein
MTHTAPNYYSSVLISNDHTTDEIFQSVDWTEWRACFAGGRIFRDIYLEPYSDRETTKEYERRRDMTPIPSYARKEIVGIRNQIGHRLPDVTRIGGSSAWRDAVNGRGRGVDLKGSSMNSYIARPFGVLDDLLVIGKVGVLLDVPRVNGPTAADIPANFRPYLSLYRVEQIKRLVPAGPDSVSDWLAVSLEDDIPSFNIETGESEIKKRIRWFYLDSERDDKLSIQILDDKGEPTEPPILTESRSVPFVLPDIGMSLMADACSYQIAMLNMISTDSSYAVDSNFPVMTRQRGQVGASDYLIGADQEAETGTRKGIFYDKGLDAPAFIAAPTGPMEWSLELRREMKLEIHDLVTGALSSVGGEGSIESGLASIGGTLNSMENRLWEHWAEAMSTNPSRREIPIVNYPVDWDVKSDKERVEEAEALLDLMNKLPGRQGKKEAAKRAYDKLYRGKVKDAELKKMKKEVDDAPYSTADPDILKMAGELGYVGTETASLALGFEEGESDVAKEEKAERAKQIVAAQSDAAKGAAMGVPEGSVDPESNKLAREGDADTTAKLGGDDEAGVRGEGN